MNKTTLDLSALAQLDRHGLSPDTYKVALGSALLWTYRNQSELHQLMRLCGLPTQTGRTFAAHWHLAKKSGNEGGNLLPSLMSLSTAIPTCSTVNALNSSDQQRFTSSGGMFSHIAANWFPHISANLVNSRSMSLGVNIGDSGLSGESVECLLSCVANIANLRQLVIKTPAVKPGTSVRNFLYCATCCLPVGNVSSDNL